MCFLFLGGKQFGELKKNQEQSLDEINKVKYKSNDPLKHLRLV
jgi:hypothetical protein